MASDEKSPNAKDEAHVKSILKHPKRINQDDAKSEARKDMKWDEMNILATYHPADKDYGHQKIDEPSTPYSKLSEDEGEGGGGSVKSDDDKDIGPDPEQLSAKLGKKSRPRIFEQPDDDSDDDKDMSGEEIVRRKSFEQKRKLHYNEFQAVKLARHHLVDDEVEDNKGKKANIDNDENSLDS